jgi:hypothetical protein
VLADERGEHLHHGRMVFCGVPGDALQRVDATDPHVELVRAELLDGLRVAVSYLSFAGQMEGARGEDQGHQGDQSGAERQQPAPRVIQRRLMKRPRD